jgi:hypothetical protein
MLVYLKKSTWSTKCTVIRNLNLETNFAQPISSINCTTMHAMQGCWDSRVIRQKVRHGRWYPRFLGLQLGQGIFLEYSWAQGSRKIRNRILNFYLFWKKRDFRGVFHMIPSKKFEIAVFQWCRTLSLWWNWCVKNTNLTITTKWLS